MSVSPFSLPVASKVADGLSGLTDLAGADAGLSVVSGTTQTSAAPVSNFGSLLTDAGQSNPAQPLPTGTAATLSQPPLSFGALPVPVGTLVKTVVPQESEETLTDSEAGVSGNPDNGAGESETPVEEEPRVTPPELPSVASPRARLAAGHGRHRIPPASQQGVPGLAMHATTKNPTSEALTDPCLTEASRQAFVPLTDAAASPAPVTTEVGSLPTQTPALAAIQQAQQVPQNVSAELGSLSTQQAQHRSVEGLASDKSRVASARIATSGEGAGTLLSQGDQAAVSASPMQTPGHAAKASELSLPATPASAALGAGIPTPTPAAMQAPRYGSQIPTTVLERQSVVANNPAVQVLGDSPTQAATPSPLTTLNPTPAPAAIPETGTQVLTSTLPSRQAVVPAEASPVQTPEGRGTENTLSKAVSASSANSSPELAAPVAGTVSDRLPKTSKEFQNVDGQLEVTSPKAAGIRNADTTGNMALRRKTQAEAFRAEDLLPTAGQSLPAMASEQAAASRSAEKPQAAEFVQRTLSIVNEVVEKMQVQAGRRVDFDVKLSTDDRVSVNVEYKNGLLHVSFRTDSADLRQALSSEWKTAMAGNADTGLRFAEPSFGGGSQQHSRGEAFDMSGGHQGQQQSRAQQQTQEERGSFFSTLSRTDAKDGAKAEGPAPRRAQAPDTTRHLNVIA